MSSEEYTRRYKFDLRDIAPPGILSFEAEGKDVSDAMNKLAEELGEDPLDISDTLDATYIWNPIKKEWMAHRPWWEEEKEPYKWEQNPGGEIPSQKEIYDCLVEYESHKSLLTERDPLALRLQRILESCYPGDPDSQFDLWCALVIDIGPGFAPIGKIMRAFKKWDVEEAYDCVELKDVYRLEPRWVKVEEPKEAENTFTETSKEKHYLNFNKDEIFKSLIAAEGHFRNFKSLKEDTAGYLNCIVKHLADAEGHCDEAISHALIAESEDSSRNFLELRDKIRDLRRYIQSSPITRDEGIREIRKVRRRFEAFNVDYDVSKCETCGDSAEVMKEITKILSDLKETPLALAAHEPEADEFLMMEREMAEKLIIKLSDKYGVKPPLVVINDECHEPNFGLYSANQITICKTGVNLHVLAHEFWHHVQSEKGMHMDEGVAEKFAVELFEAPHQKGLYSVHNHSHNELKMVKSIKDVGIIYGLQQLGFAADYGLKYADTLRPEGLLGQPVSFWGDIIGTVGGIVGALYLKAPYDLAAAMVGGYLSTDLWNQLTRLVPMRVATPTRVYTPPGNISQPAVTAKGRYIIS